MKRIGLIRNILGLSFLASPLFGADLLISTGSYVITSNVTYNLVTVNGTGSLSVINDGFLTVTGALVGQDQSSFLIDRGTVRGRVNITSSKKFHLLNATLSNTEGSPSNSIINSGNIVIAHSRIDAVTPLSQAVGGSAAIQLISPNDIYVSDSKITVTAGPGATGYYGGQRGGGGELTVQSTRNAYVDPGSILTCSGSESRLSIKGDVIYLNGAQFLSYGKSASNGYVIFDAQEINGAGNTLYAEGGTGLAGSIHGGTIYAFPTGGGNGKMALTGKIVNLASNSLVTQGGAGGYMPTNSYGIPSGGPGSGDVAIKSTQNSNPSLYSNTITTPLIDIQPASISGAGSSTVEIVRRRIEDFQDRNLWSPSTTLGWWDIDDVKVYKHNIVDSFAVMSSKTMRVDFNKSDLPWSLYGGYLDALNPSRDFTSFNTVRVWAKGDTTLLMKLRDRSLQGRDVGTQSLSTADEVALLDFNFDTVKNEYYKTRINLNDMDNLLFFAAPGQSTVSGTFYINAIELTNTAKIEDFEDGNLWSPNTTLGWWDVDGTVVYRHSLVTSPCHEGGSCMKTEFTKAGRAWSSFGGNVSGLNPNLNISAYRKLSFWLYGNVSILVKMVDKAYVGQDLGTVQGVANAWKRVEVDFSDAVINKNQLDNILFFAAPGNASATGTFYIDDLKLTK
jgi:hypothetical protein